jgi:hypothetical protein
MHSFMTFIVNIFNKYTADANVFLTKTTFWLLSARKKLKKSEYLQYKYKP